MGLCNSIFRRSRNSLNNPLSPDADLEKAELGEYFSFSGRKIQAKIVSVYDGDTCTAIFRMLDEPNTKSNNKRTLPLIQYKIRMIGVDTPELKPLLSTPNRDKVVGRAKEAKKVVEDKILNKIVILDCKGFDKYGRILAVITVDNLNLNKWLLDNHYAVNYDGGTKEI